MLLFLAHNLLLCQSWDLIRKVSNYCHLTSHLRSPLRNANARIHYNHSDFVFLPYSLCFTAKHNLQCAIQENQL